MKNLLIARLSRPGSFVVAPHCSPSENWTTWSRPADNSTNPPVPWLPAVLSLPEAPLLPEAPRLPEVPRLPAHLWHPGAGRNAILWDVGSHKLLTDLLDGYLRGSVEYSLHSRWQCPRFRASGHLGGSVGSEQPKPGRPTAYDRVCRQAMASGLHH